MRWYPSSQSYLLTHQVSLQRCRRKMLQRITRIGIKLRTDLMGRVAKPRSKMSTQTPTVRKAQLSSSGRGSIYQDQTRRKPVVTSATPMRCSTRGRLVSKTFRSFKSLAMAHTRVFIRCEGWRMGFHMLSKKSR